MHHSRSYPQEQARKILQIRLSIEPTNGTPGMKNRCIAGRVAGAKEL